MRTAAYLHELGCLCFFSLPAKRVVEVCANGDLLITSKKTKGFWGKKIHRKVSIATATVELIDEKADDGTEVRSRRSSSITVTPQVGKPFIIQAASDEKTVEIYDAIMATKKSLPLDASGSATPPLSPQPSPPSSTSALTITTTNDDDYVPPAQLRPALRVNLGPAVAITSSPAPATATPNTTTTTTTTLTRAAPNDEYLLKPLHTMCCPPIAQPAEWLTRCLELLGAAMLVLALYFVLPAFAGMVNTTTIVALMSPLLPIVAKMGLSVGSNYVLHALGELVGDFGYLTFLAQVLAMVGTFYGVCDGIMGLTPDYVVVKLGLVMGAIVLLLKEYSFACTSATYRRLAAKRMLHWFIHSNKLEAEAISTSNFVYFICAPTLVFQTKYPRTGSVNWGKVFSYVLQLVAINGVSLLIGLKLILPAVVGILGAWATSRVDFALVMNLATLSGCSTFVWLFQVAFGVFHVTMLLIAEVTRFGDRVFYKNWWECKTMKIFWNTWNQPIHGFLKRHLCQPLIRAGSPGGLSFVIVFAVSAFFHEIIMVVALSTHLYYRNYGLCGAYAFLGIFGQLGTIKATAPLEKYPRVVGNSVFWLTFCVLGQPLAVLLYANDLMGISVVAAMA